MSTDAELYVRDPVGDLLCVDRITVPGLTSSTSSSTARWEPAGHDIYRTDTLRPP